MLAILEHGVKYVKQWRCNVSTQDRILIGQSCAKDAREAVREFHAAVSGPNLSLVIFFCSSQYDLDVVASEMNQLFPNVTVVGCTTAGEIGPAGYLKHSFSGVSFPSAHCVAVSGSYDELQKFESRKGHEFVDDLLQRLEMKKADIGSNNSFAFMLIDGLSMREEPVVSAFQRALGDIGLFGGSAGDDQQFKHTWVFCDGVFREDRAALVLVSTTYPFKLFKAQHFITSQERLVVTKANASQRIVFEINGLPAAEEYARLTGVLKEHLNAAYFSAFPVVVRINGMDYVRSIKSSNPDGSLSFFCAIDEGIVLRVAQGINLVANLEQTFANIRDNVGQPQLVLTCDCVHRNIEIMHTDVKDAVEEIFKQNNAVGFSTYGEQFMGVHINQTITGIAIGELGKKHDV